MFCVRVNSFTMLISKGCLVDEREFRTEMPSERLVDVNLLRRKGLEKARLQQPYQQSLSC